MVTPRLHGDRGNAFCVKTNVATGRCNDDVGRDRRM
jgi:hypothetical protein